MSFEIKFAGFDSIKRFEFLQLNPADKYLIQFDADMYNHFKLSDCLFRDGYLVHKTIETYGTGGYKSFPADYMKKLFTEIFGSEARFWLKVRLFRLGPNGQFSQQGLSFVPVYCKDRGMLLLRANSIEDLLYRIELSNQKTR